MQPTVRALQDSLTHVPLMGGAHCGPDQQLDLARLQDVMDRYACMRCAAAGRCGRHMDVQPLHQRLGERKGCAAAGGLVRARPLLHELRHVCAPAYPCLRVCAYPCTQGRVCVCAAAHPCLSAHAHPCSRRGMFVLQLMASALEPLLAAAAAGPHAAAAGSRLSRGGRPSESRAGGSLIGARSSEVCSALVQPLLGALHVGAACMLVQPAWGPL